MGCSCNLERDMASKNSIISSNEHSLFELLFDKNQNSKYDLFIITLEYFNFAEIINLSFTFK